MGFFSVFKKSSSPNNEIYLYSVCLCVDDSADEEPTSQSDHSEIQGTLKTLASKLDDLSTCNDLIAKHGAALQRSLSELETLRVPLEGGEKIKAVNERATLFRITSNAMINVSTELTFCYHRISVGSGYNYCYFVHFSFKLILIISVYTIVQRFRVKDFFKETYTLI